MMIQLQGHSLTAQRVLHPETFALNLSERDSTATITLPPDAPEIALGDWLQDTTEPGAGIVWRVKTNDNQVNAGQRTHTLEHMIRSLADRILGEVYPEDMSGEELTPAEKKTAVCTARQALEYILALQDDWVLGTLDPVYEEVSKPYHFNGDTLMAALETVSGSLEDPLWTYDFSVYPFRLNILHIPETVGCEMRAGRNITTLKITEDRSRLYTRIYPIGKNNLRLPDPGYLSQNEQLYGVIEKTETDQSQETEEQLTMWAQERLSRHCEPSVTVTISGLNLSEATGEPLDRLTIGKRCRVPLPSNGSVILEKVTKLAWRDKIKEPESVTVTLANALEDVQSILRQEKNAAGKHGRTAAKQSQDYILVIGGVESGLYTRVAQTASEIRQEAHREAESMRTLIYQTASEIRSEAASDKESLRSLISQTASQVALKVSKGDVATQLTVECGNVHVSGSQGAANLTVDGMITATDLAAGEISAITLTNDGVLTTYDLSAYHGEFTSYVEAQEGFYVGGPPGTGEAVLVASDLPDDMTTGLSLTRSGDTYTLSWTDYDGTPHSENFSRATTLTGAWSSGTFTVTASPQGDTFSTTPSMRLNGSNQDNFSVELLTDDSTPAVTASIHGYLGTSGSGSSRVVKVYKDQEKTQAVAQISVPTSTYAHSASLTRYRAGAVESIIPGKMYRKNSDNTYTALGSSSSYWFETSTNIGSSKTVYYN